jgi:hypothetical protein
MGNEGISVIVHSAGITIWRRKFTTTAQGVAVMIATLATKRQ